MLNKYIKFAK